MIVNHKGAKQHKLINKTEQEHENNQQILPFSTPKLFLFFSVT